MPEISRFYGIVIQMYFGDHPPPHFHARYAGQSAKLDIDTLADHRRQTSGASTGLGDRVGGNSSGRIANSISESGEAGRARQDCTATLSRSTSSTGFVHAGSIANSEDLARRDRQKFPSGNSCSCSLITAPVKSPNALRSPFTSSRGNAPHTPFDSTTVIPSSSPSTSATGF